MKPALASRIVAAAVDVLVGYMRVVVAEALDLLLEPKPYTARALCDKKSKKWPNVSVSLTVS